MTATLGPFASMSDQLRGRVFRQEVVCESYSGQASVCTYAHIDASPSQIISAILDLDARLEAPRDLCLLDRYEIISQEDDRMVVRWVVTSGPPFGLTSTDKILSFETSGRWVRATELREERRIATPQLHIQYHIEPVFDGSVVAYHTEMVSRLGRPFTRVFRMLMAHSASREINYLRHCVRHQSQALG